MALFATRIKLEDAIKDETAKLLNPKFEAALPRFIAGAEQRMFYGSGAPLPSEPLRLRSMEATADLEIDAGEGELPADYLAGRRMRFDGSPKSVPLYEAPDVFWSNRYQTTTGSPVRYTIEGSVIYTSPEITGDMPFLYYAKPDFLVDPDDTNAVLTEYPMLYLHASLIEAYRYLRNAEKTQEAFANYTSASSGLLSTERKARQGANALAMRIPNTRVN
jgi:hypothetical protein